MYTYRLTPPARKDLEEINRDIRDKLMDSASAKGLMEAFAKAFAGACRFPFRLPPVMDPRLKAQGYRKIIVKNYIAFVLIDEEQEFVDVMRVLYHARNYQELL